MIGATNAGGGRAGAKLAVTAPAGVTVTASKSGKTFTRIATSTGKATFNGLETGTWALSISDATHEATTPVNVDILTDYSVTLSFFSATINITYPANSTCTVTNKSTGEIVGRDTNAGESEKTWACVVGAAGTYTVTATATDGSEETATDEAEITADGQSVSKTLDYTFYLFKSGRGFRSGFSIIQDDGTTYESEDTEKINLYKHVGIFNPGIDLSKFSTLYFDGYKDTDYRGNAGVSSSSTDYGANPSSGTPYKAYVDIPKTTRAVKSVDISGISITDGYIKLAVVNGHLYMYNIWLE